jgi:hypothetical protein
VVVWTPSTSSAAEALPIDGGAPIDSNTMVGDAFVFAYDWSCIGHDPTGTVPASVTVTGTVTDFFSDPIAGVAVVGHKLDGSQVGSPASTGASGNYSLALATGSQPLVGYVNFFLSDYMPFNIFTPDPLIGDIDGVSAFLITPNLVSGFAAQYGATLQPGDGVVVVTVEDCQKNPVRDAEVTVDQADSNTRVYYLGEDGLPDIEAARTSVNGEVIIINVNPGPITVHFNHPLAPAGLQTYDMVAFPDQISATQMHP